MLPSSYKEYSIYMPHFVAHSPRFPYLRVNVPELKKFREERGILNPGTWVKFDSGFLDTVAQGFTEEETPFIAEALRRAHAANIQLEFTENGVKAKLNQEPLQIREAAKK